MAIFERYQGTAEAPLFWFRKSNVAVLEFDTLAGTKYDDQGIQNIG